jgi:aryl-alcohol dehydrogenase-like predicted oxidoreductase
MGGMEQGDLPGGVRRERGDGGGSLSRRKALGLMAAAAVSDRGVGWTAPPLLMRPIPVDGTPLPAVGVGTWQTFDVGAGDAERNPLREVLRSFVALGGRVVDSSPMYGQAETVVGDLASELGLQGSLFVATKVWTQGREAGVVQMERSLKRLRVARIDLMQVHNLVDAPTHLATLRDWKAGGRVRYVGVTHYTASAYGELERVMRREQLDFVQLNYSLGEREAEERLLPLAQERGIAVIVNRPYAEGALFRRVRGRPLPPWAAELDCKSWGQFFLKWILAHPAVTCAIPGTGKPEHLTDNMGAGIGSLPDAATRARMAAHFDGL